MIATGKTTYTQMLAETLAFEPFYESVDNNPILAKYYADPIQYGLMSQVYFATTRFNSLRRGLTQPRNIVDRSIYEDMLFAQVNYEFGYLTNEEKQVYDTLVNELVDTHKFLLGNQKVLYVYLKASFDTILSRIDMRGRTYEQQQKLTEYYKTLHLRYDSWMSKYYTPEQILTIDADKYDVKKPEDRSAVMNMIFTRLQALGL